MAADVRIMLTPGSDTLLGGIVLVNQIVAYDTF